MSMARDKITLFRALRCDRLLVPDTFRGPGAVVNRLRYGREIIQTYHGITATEQPNPSDSMNLDRIIHLAGNRRSYPASPSDIYFIRR